MDRKSFGLVLLVLGIILLIISLMTIWSMYVNFNLSNGLLIILSIPLFIFSVSAIFFAVILITQERVNIKIKGLIMIMDGLISILTTVYTMLDIRLAGLSLISNIVLIPMILISAFFIIYGIFLFASGKYLRGVKIKKKVMKSLGVISIFIGIINIISFILLLTINPNHPIILIAFWVLLSVVLIFFGSQLIIKKVDTH